MTSSTRALILGCGYVGLALAKYLRAAGIDTLATSRSEDRFGEIAATGATPRVADVMEPASLRALVDDKPDVVFDLVRPQKLADDRYTSWGSQNVAKAFAGRDGPTVVYLSSTSVYGRRDGELTDETTPTAPNSPVGKARVEAERVYLDAFEERGAPVRICRVPGIYGPGRTLRGRLENGAYRRLDDERIWVSRIHVEDLAAALFAAWRKGQDGRIYLLCDDEPVTSDEYARITATLLSLPLPPTVERADIRGELSKDAFERRISSRRCSNRRMHDELGVDLTYPSVREGVPAALKAEGVI